MPDSQYFDYPSAARDAGMTDDQLRLIEKLFRSEYPNDQMLFELHVVRACLSIKAGRMDLEAVRRDAESQTGSSAA